MVKIKNYRVWMKQIKKGLIRYWKILKRGRKISKINMS
jgi:hypothetical protein